MLLLLHIEFSLALNVLKQYTCINSFETRMKPDINSTENSVDPDQLASEKAS